MLNAHYEFSGRTGSLAVDCRRLIYRWWSSDLVDEDAARGILGLMMLRGRYVKWGRMSRRHLIRSTAAIQADASTNFTNDLPEVLTNRWPI
jgi:hypothetical protein